MAQLLLQGLIELETLEASQETWARVGGQHRSGLISSVVYSAAIKISPARGRCSCRYSSGSASVRAGKGAHVNIVCKYCSYCPDAWSTIRLLDQSSCQTVWLPSLAIFSRGWDGYWTLCVATRSGTALLEYFPRRYSLRPRRDHRVQTADLQEVLKLFMYLIRQSSTSSGHVPVAFSTVQLYATIWAAWCYFPAHAGKRLQLVSHRILHHQLSTVPQHPQ